MNSRLQRLRILVNGEEWEGDTFLNRPQSAEKNKKGKAFIKAVKKMENKKFSRVKTLTNIK